MATDDPNKTPGAVGLRPRRVAIAALRRGYRGLSLRGRGPIGPSYEARSLLDGRPKTLWTLRPDLLAKAPLAARLAREALAATHLDHPNLARVEDLVPIGDTLAIVAESVPGRRLNEPTEAGKRLEARDAAIAVLHAARGLKHAHDRGLDHRRLSPSQLVLQPDGIVKVLGVGLIQDPGLLAMLAASDEEPESPGLGEPTSSAYAVAEPPGEPSRVDRQGDILALGRTLWILATGRDPVDPPDPTARSPRLPAELDAIFRRMTGDDPTNRASDLGEFIRDLERYLGIEGSDPAAAHPELGEAIRRAAETYARPPSAPQRRGILLGASGLLAVLVLLSVLVGRSVLAAGLLAFGLLTGFGLGVAGERWRSPRPVLARLRATIVDRLLYDPLTGLVVVGLALLAVWATGLLGVFTTLGVASALLVLAYRMTVGERFERERQEVAATAAGLLKDLRLRGYGEATIRRLVQGHGGPHWQGLFEALFGLEAVREAMATDSQAPGSWIDRFWTIARDQVCRRLGMLAYRQAARRRRTLFQTLEERSACARGVYLLTARRRSWRVAEAVATVDEELRALSAVRVPGPPPDVAGALREAVRHPETVLVDREAGLMRDRRDWRFEPYLDSLLGPRMRFLAGAALAAGCLVWVHQNAMVPGDQLGALAGRVAEVRDLAGARELAENAGRLHVEVPEETTPLHLPPLPHDVTEPLGSVGAGVAGAILLLSAFLRGWRPALLVLPAAVVALLGPRLGIPAVGGLGAEGVSIALALGIAVPVLFLARGR